MAALERRIEEMKIGIIDIKNQTREVARSCDSASELFEQKQTQNQMQNQMQNQILNSKIDKLLQLVKDEVVNRLEQQSKKDDDLEDSVKSLQNTVQELQKTVEALKSETSSKTQASTNPFSSPLPQHRSQPSLNPYLEVANEPGRDNLQRPMQAIPEGRNDARFQYNYGGGNNGTYPHGNGFNNGSQHWYRPSTAGREGKDDNNSYPRAGYMGMGNGNAYGSYYPGGANEQGFGYNSGMSK
jgi:arsenate reductase-like glutaredoxin family protein